MIIDNVHRFAFVHIPKCGGSSVHAQLSKWDSRDAAFHRPGNHPQMGDVHFAHLPLAFLKTYYPADFDKLSRYSSFAVTRDPRARFVSATVQRLREFRGVHELNLDIKLVVNEAHQTIEWLSGRDAFCDLGYIHFSRQLDHVELAGRRVVANVFAIEDMGAFAVKLEATCGVTFDAERRENTSLASHSRLLAAVHSAKPLYSRLTSWKTRERLLLLMRRLKLRRPDALYVRLLRDRKIARFIEDYYAADFELHDAALGGAARRGDPCVASELSHS
jgi:hypothetical protein